MNHSIRGHRSPLGCFPGQPTPRLYDRVVEVLRAGRYSRPTSTGFAASLCFTPVRPCELGEGHVNTFLTRLAVKENVARFYAAEVLLAIEVIGIVKCCICCM